MTEPTTWAEVLTGDVIRGVDGVPYLVGRYRKGRAHVFALSRPDRPLPVRGSPDLSTPVERVQLGPTSYAVSILRTAFPELSIMEES